MNRKRQRGFTLVELLKVIFWLGFWVLVIGVVIHFVLKFW